MTAFVYRYTGILLAFWMGFVFLLCAMPGQYLPSTNWMDLLSLDKWIHAALFFGLCVLWFLWAFKRKQTNRRIILYTLAGILYGISLEYMQALWFSNRSFDYFDMLANTIGCCFALSIHKFLFRKFSVWAN